MTDSTVDNGKTIAIISYITLIGWIIALVMHSSNKTKLGAFHIRQMLGIILIGLALTIFGRFMGIISIMWLLNVAVFVLWVIGLVSAINGEEKELPVVGKYFQEWFQGVA